MPLQNKFTAETIKITEMKKIMYFIGLATNGWIYRLKGRRMIVTETICKVILILPIFSNQLRMEVFHFFTKQP